MESSSPSTPPARALRAARRLLPRSAVSFAARTSFTACAAYLAASLLGLEQPMWAPVSALVVVQGSARGTLRAVADRVLGTFAGAAAAVLVAAVLGRLGTPMVVQMAVVVALVAGAVATLRPAARVATWTSVIVLTSTIAPGHPMMNAAWRIAGVAVGAIVAAAAGLVTGRSPAMQALRAELGTALSTMAGALRSRDGERPLVEADAAETALRRCDALLADARRPVGGSGAEELASVVQATRRLRHSLLTLGRLRAPLTGDGGAAVNAVVDMAAGQLARHVDAVADALDGRGEPPDPADLEEIVRAIAQVVRGLRADGVMRRLSDADAQAIYLRRFAVERAAQDAAELTAQAIARAA